MLNLNDRFSVECRDSADYTIESDFFLFASDMDARSVRILRDTHETPERFRVTLPDGKIVNLTNFDENAVYSVDIVEFLRDAYRKAETEQDTLISCLVAIAKTRTNPYSNMLNHANEIKSVIRELATDEDDDEIWRTSETLFGKNRELLHFGYWLQEIVRTINELSENRELNEGIFKIYYRRYNAE